MKNFYKQLLAFALKRLHTFDKNGDGKITLKATYDLKTKKIETEIL